MHAFDLDIPYEEISGPFTRYKYVQNGMFFTARMVRVHPDTGNVWTERNDSIAIAINTLEEMSKEKPILKGAVKVAKKGVVLPRRILEKGKK